MKGTSSGALFLLQPFKIANVGVIPYIRSNHEIIIEMRKTIFTLSVLAVAFASCKKDAFVRLL